MPNRHRSRHALATAVLALLLVVTAADAAGQQASRARWSVSIATGPSSGGPRHGMEADLRRERWDDVSPGFLFFPIPHPFSVAGDYATTLRVGYRFRPSFGLGLLLSKNPLGYVSGYRANETSLGTWLAFSPSVNSAALLASFHVTAANESVSLRLDAGPAFHRAYIGHGGDDHAKLGAVLGVGAGVRVWKLRFSLDAQRRFVGDVPYGDYEIYDTLADEVATFGPASADFDHDTILFGIGFGV